ncbi:MAG: M67 family metallopeptidase [Sphingomonadaceae bacterium]|uniref:M67 family metallopeptidase n=1 Tax=Thermaurantiacus sp. TaxID=2820283 RepID=UPI00298F1E17|nr:M67 family metallopeptidase [Thermaurantiacus sp.]MCS6987134.1 M67 family metallopeptidase [Sphingomonadaceae bacterium]MDW8415832.1 M67 family metallopeptidase [Thermaurantiacus sp.]
MRVWLARGARLAITRAAALAHPHEACGLLLGDRAAEGWRVRWASVGANVAAEPHRRFELDPGHLFAAWRAARAGGPAILGVWHSHPSGAPTLSEADRAGVTDPGWLWLVVTPEDMAVFLPDPEQASGFRPLLLLPEDAGSV